MTLKEHSDGSHWVLLGKFNTATLDAIRRCTEHKHLISLGPEARKRLKIQLGDIIEIEVAFRGVSGTRLAEAHVSKGNDEYIAMNDVLRKTCNLDHPGYMDGHHSLNLQFHPKMMMGKAKLVITADVMD
jgi:hypothetical protein